MNSLIESSSGLLLTDVNSIDVDEIDEKLFIVGGKIKHFTLKNIFPFFAMLPKDGKYFVSMHLCSVAHFFHQN